MSCCGSKGMPLFVAPLPISDGMSDREGACNVRGVKYETAAFELFTVAILCA